MTVLRQALRAVLTCAALAALTFGDAQTTSQAAKSAAQTQAAKYGAAQLNGVKRRLKIRRHRKPKTGTTNANNGAQTNGGQKGNSGSGNGASTQSGSSSNKNNSDNNSDNSNHNTQTSISGATVMAGLINVNVQNVNVNAYKVIDIHNVLNNSQVEVLTQKIINSPGATAKQDVLTNLLRDAKVLNGNQIVVGVLSSIHRIFYTTKPKAPSTTGSTGGGKG
jgi:hypothetical protein